MDSLARTELEMTATMSSPINMLTPLSQLPWLTRQELVKLEQANIRTVHALLMNLPRRYEDRQLFTGVGQVVPNRPVCFKARVVDVQWKNRGKHPKSPKYFEATVEDSTGFGGARISCVWFQIPFIHAKLLAAGQSLVIYGTPKAYGRKLSMAHPEYEILQTGEGESIHTNRIVPIYSERHGINGRRLREIIFHTLETLPDAPDAHFYEFSPQFTRASALNQLHFPASDEALIKARRYFALEECFTQQLNVVYRKNHETAKDGISTCKSWNYVRDLYSALPFDLTTAQKRCIKEIAQDMRSLRPMNRLLQGDVGSGKTLVALCAMLLAVNAGYQAILMAPTQILAEQHYNSFAKLLAPLDIGIELMTAGRREQTHVSAHATPIIIGTHALLHAKQDTFDHVGLVVIDEQHKFGVSQREKLVSLGKTSTAVPDVLVMTATPIPRTLTLTVYGDLDVSIIDELPPGRAGIKTLVRPYKVLPKVVEFLQKQLEDGRQIYIVSPKIEEDETKETKSVLQEEKKWRKLLPHIDIGLMHGKLPSEEKETIMADFRRGKLQVLISTTVVEVGVDVANATVMIINHAESFSLPQLHQLRGRIGRGAHRSYCILLSDADDSPLAEEKLRIMESTSDGFALAEHDLRLRGPGEILGTMQSGKGTILFNEWLLDVRLLHRARALAEQFLTADPELASPQNRILRNLLTTNHPNLHLS